MAFTLNSRVKIGRYSFTGGISEVVIQKSVYNISEVAKLKIPASAGKVVTAGSMEVDSNVKVSTAFNIGDKVSIELGYNGDLRNEFTGFVTRLHVGVPLMIDMEGYAYQLRKSNILASWKKTTLKEVLTHVIQGTDIVLSPDIPDMALTAFYIKNISGLHVLDYLHRKFLLTVYFDGNVLYAGLDTGRTTAIGPGQSGTLAAVKYSIGYNCVSEQPDLKKRFGAENLVRVRLKTCGKDGKHTLYEAGDEGGEVHERIIPFTTDEQYLKATADAFLRRLKYQDYSGGLRCFLQPYCAPGWKAVLIDKPYDGERAGTFFISGTEVRFGVRGAQRIPQISYRLDN